MTDGPLPGGRAKRWRDAASLNQQLIDDLGDLAVKHGDVAEKPLELHCAAPLPRLVRAYVWVATSPKGERAVGDYKVQLTLPGFRRGERSYFDFNHGAWALLLGWNPDHETWILWDAGCHDGFAYSSNVQVHAETVYTAAIAGICEQTRQLRRGGGHQETVIAARRDRLAEALMLRVRRTSERLLAEGSE